jgi:hypothetical protein
MSDWRTVSTVLAGDSAEYAVDDFKKLFNLMLGGNQTLVDIASTGKWRFRDNVAQFSNPANTFRYNIRTSAIITADKDITIPLLTANANFVFDSFNNLFTANQWFNNNLAIYWKDTGGTLRQVLKAASNDEISIGDTVGWSAINLTPGASVAMRISSANLVTISPTWGVLLPISLNAQSLLQIYRPLNTVGGGSRAGIEFDHQDSGLTKVLSGYLLFSIVDNTAGAFDSQFEVWVRNNSLSHNALIVDNVGKSTWNVIGTAGVAESVANWNIVDAAGSALEIINATATDANFAPWIRAKNIGTLTTTNALILDGQILLANDSGTTAVNRFIARTSIAGQIAVRPLFDFMNESQSVFKINAKGDAEQTVITQAGVAETIHTWNGPVDSDANSYLKIFNASTTDATFAPKIVGSTTKASTNAMMLWGWISVANDTGTTPIVNIDGRRQDGTAITTRPIFSVSNLNTSLFVIQSTGQMTNVHQDETITEKLFEITLSDAAGSYFRILNNLGGVVGLYAPQIVGHNAAANTTYSGLYFQGSIDAAQDSGNTPAITVDSRAGPSTALVTRPLISFRNAATNLFTIGAQGDVAIDHKAQAGAAEVILEAGVADDASSYFRIANISTTDAEFIPRIIFNNAVTGAATRNELLFQIPTAGDTGTTPLLSLLVRNSTGNVALVTKPLLDIRNAGNTILKINANGDFVQTAIAQAGVGEALHHWGVSDNATAYLRISNITATDSLFAPRLVSYNFGAGVGVESLRLQSYIEAGSDSGVIAIQVYDVRRATEAAITTRTLFEWRNFGVPILQITPTAIDMNGLLLRDLYGVQQEPTQRYVSLMISPTISFRGTGAYNEGSTITGTSTHGNDSSGGFARITAAASIDALAMAASVTTVTARGSNPKWRWLGSFDQVTDIRLKFGFNTAGSFQLGATAGSTMFSSAQAGFGFRFIHGVDTTIQLVTNDATVTENVIDTGFTPAAVTTYILELAMDTSTGTVSWAIYASTGTVLASGSTTTKVPTTAHMLFRVLRSENITATAKSFVTRWEMLYKSGVGAALPY